MIEKKQTTRTTGRAKSIQKTRRRETGIKRGSSLTKSVIQNGMEKQWPSAHREKDQQTDLFRIRKNKQLEIRALGKLPCRVEWSRPDLVENRGDHRTAGSLRAELRSSPKKSNAASSKKGILVRKQSLGGASNPKSWDEKG